MSLQIKPPETKTKNSPPPRLTLSFSSLPNEITVTCLARISRSYYPKLSIISKSFHSLLFSTELYAARSHLKTTEQCLYVCLRNCNKKFHQWFLLGVNPKKKKTTGMLPVPNPPSNFHSVSISSVAVGSYIYVIGGEFERKPSSTLRILDCRTHTWRDAPKMKAARVSASSCVHDSMYLEGARMMNHGLRYSLSLFDLTLYPSY